MGPIRGSSYISFNQSETGILDNWPIKGKESISLQKKNPQYPTLVKLIRCKPDPIGLSVVSCKETFFSTRSPGDEDKCP